MTAASSEWYRIRFAYTELRGSYRNAGCFSEAEHGRREDVQRDEMKDTHMSKSTLSLNGFDSTWSTLVEH